MNLRPVGPAEAPAMLACVESAEKLEPMPAVGQPMHRQTVPTRFISARVLSTLQPGQALKVYGYIVDGPIAKASRLTPGARFEARPAGESTWIVERVA